ncbi:MAG: hypothetical protein NTW61_05965 [Candidatus Melainabacteria bacterium]|nr:hypothetical protein [Candidatus Melainabacteria bacterium]
MIVTQLPHPTNLFEWMDTISKLIEIGFQAMGTLHPNPNLGHLFRLLCVLWMHSDSSFKGTVSSSSIPLVIFIL